MLQVNCRSFLRRIDGTFDAVGNSVHFENVAIFGLDVVNLNGVALLADKFRLKRR